jgi:enamidase|tara:strand:- start:1674 stop:2879 length:1206 start_codon:yes stop_codon:yes gene_type:complete
MYKTAIINLGKIVSGNWRKPFKKGDGILMDRGLIKKVGTLNRDDIEKCEFVLDANGMTAIPGLIDSQVHIAFGDYTPRQRAIGFLESYLHGGVTTSITASEVHVPGRPKDPDGVVALAVAAKKSFDNYSPGGMRVHGGAVILEPGLTQKHFDYAADKGVWIAKAGFGQFKSAFEYKPFVKMAQKSGMIVNVHTGGASIPDSSPIHGDHLLDMMPDVSFHVNGGPVAMPDKDFPRVINESKIALQICQAGNIRTALMCLDLAISAEAFDRIIFATDTPTGTGVMPLGMIKTICEMSCLSSYSPEMMISAATGNNAVVYKLNNGFIERGKDADIILLDAALGCSKKDALSSIKNGDYPAITAVFTQGIPRFIGRSRNTPPATKKIKVYKNNILNSFDPGRHTV